MTPVRVQLDFVRRQPKFPLAGVLVLLIGCGAAYWTFTDYRNSVMQTELLDISLSRYQQTRATKENPVNSDDLAKMAAATRPLSTPWSALLNDLEGAAQDTGKDIALLEVAPDREKRQVRISAEARSLPAALDYVTRLQGSQTLLYPMLENHEVRTASRERPVRFEISAEWSLPQ
jgi:hypothetical protein